MEPTFTTGQVVVFHHKITGQFLPAIVKAVDISDDNIEYRLDVQSGTGHELRSEESTGTHESILTFKEFAETVKNEALEGLDDTNFD